MHLELLPLGLGPHQAETTKTILLSFKTLKQAQSVKSVDGVVILGLFIAKKSVCELRDSDPHKNGTYMAASSSWPGHGSCVA